MYVQKLSVLCRFFSAAPLGMPCARCDGRVWRAQSISEGDSHSVVALISVHQDVFNQCLNWMQECRFWRCSPDHVVESMMSWSLWFVLWYNSSWPLCHTDTDVVHSQRPTAMWIHCAVAAWEWQCIQPVALVRFCHCHQLCLVCRATQTVHRFNSF